MNIEDETSLEFNALHEKLPRCAKLYWLMVESGAPGISFSRFDEVDDTQNLDEKVLEFAKSAIEESSKQVLTEDLKSAIGSLAQALEIVLDHGEIKPGMYDCQKSKIDTTSLEILGINLKNRFELTHEHIMLIRKLSVREGVLPYIDPKRPYGNMTYFEFEMAKASGMTLPRNGAGFPEKEKQHLHKLHFEMLPALHVFLRNAKIERGTFKHKRFTRPWERV